jgi:hypothetical protein
MTMMLAHIKSVRYTPGMTTLSDTIREAIKTCGQSRYAISKTTGISQAALSRFIHGMPMRSNNLDTLAELLGLEVRPKAKARSGRGR